MSLKIDRVQLEIVIGNDQARKRMREIDQEVRTLNNEIKKMQKSGADTSSHEARIKGLKIEYDQLTEQIGLTGLSLKELRNRQRELNAWLQQTPGNSPLYKQYKTQLDEVNNRMLQLRGNAKHTEGVLSKFANGFNKFLPMTASFIAGITGTVLSFRKLSEEVAQLDDVYSDVMKTTGMTRDEVVALNEEFKKLDTRTTREDLNKIAEEGGRIGILKDDIQEFTEAMNMAKVALGDSFTGGVEEIASKLGKLKMLFSETKEMGVEKAYLAIGSSINDLGADGVASERNIAEFTTRIGALPDVLKPSIADTLALGAAFEESGIEAEIASRAYGIILNRATKNTEGFARVMKMSVSEVEDLINTNPLEFFLKFSESLKGLNAVDTARTLNELKISADGANKVVGAASNNTERFRELLVLSNKSFEEGTSIVNEYNIKNENLNAKLEKSRKGFKEARLELGERLNPALLKSTNLMTYMVKVLPDVLDWFGKYGGILVKVTALILAYNIGIKAQTMWTKLALVEKIKLTVANVKETASMVALNLRYLAGSKSAAELGRSIKALYAIMKLNPWGAAITALTAVGILVYELVKRNRQFTSEAGAMVDINKKVADSVAQERAELDMLLRVARNENISKEEREKAIRRLNEISPEYLGNLNLENINTQEATIAVNNYTEALMENAKQKAIADKMSELYAKRLKYEAEREEHLQILQGRRDAGLSQSDIDRSHQNRVDKMDREIKKVDQLIDVYGKLGETMLGNRPATRGGSVVKPTTNVDPDDIDPYIPGGDDEDSGKKKKGKSALQLKEEELKESYNRQLLLLKKSLLEKQITEDQFRNYSYMAETEHLLAMIELRNENDVSTTDLETQLTDKMIAESNRRYSNLEKLQKEHLDNLKKRPQEEAVEEEEWQPKSFGDRKKMLDLQFEYDMISEQEHQEELFKLREEYLDKYFEKYLQISKSVEGISNDLSGAISGFQQAEEMSVENKYNKMIKAAGNNSKKVKQLEEEKEKKLHEVRAKYADKQFIVTVAQVIASTAVSAMEAFKAMAGIPVVGPALGGIAAAAAVAYGAGQIAIAKQQRDAAKAGYRTGGYTGIGDDRDEAGVVHRNEFVNTADAVRNPHVKRFLDVFDIAQKNGTIRMLNTTQILERVRLGNSVPEKQTSVYNSTVPTEDIATIDTLNRLRDSVDRFTEKLDIPIKTYTEIHGPQGARRQNELYDKIMKNARL